VRWLAALLILQAACIAQICEAGTLAEDDVAKRCERGAVDHVLSDPRLPLSDELRWIVTARLARTSPTEALAFIGGNLALLDAAPIRSFDQDSIDSLRVHLRQMIDLEVLGRREFDLLLAAGSPKLREDYSRCMAGRAKTLVYLKRTQTPQVELRIEQSGPSEAPNEVVIVSLGSGEASLMLPALENGEVRSVLMPEVPFAPSREVTAGITVGAQSIEVYLPPRYELSVHEPPKHEEECACAGRGP
jgi:hypothetical protein